MGNARIMDSQQGTPQALSELSCGDRLYELQIAEWKEED